MIVTGVHKDCMDRQVMEGVNISNFGGDILMNRIGESGGVRVERQQYKFQEGPPIHTLPTCKTSRVGGGGKVENLAGGARAELEE